jgi:hypothetical protein
VELPRRTTAPRASEAGPEPRAERTAAAEPQTVGGRFDRGLRRVTREQTSLLSWLAESNTAGVLRSSPPEIDLRDDELVDVRDDASSEPVADDLDVVDVTESAEVPAGSLFQR